MKSTRKYLFAVCVLALGFAIPSIHAEETAPPKEHGGPGPKGDRFGELKQKLNLTDAQVSQLKTILADEHTQMKALHEKEGAKDEKMAEVKKIHEATQAKIAAILTPEQKAKFDEMRKHGPKGDKGPKDEKKP